MIIMSEQYCNYDGKNWYNTDKPIRNREYKAKIYIDIRIIYYVCLKISIL